MSKSTVLVVGGNSDIAKPLIKSFCNYGYEVSITCRSEEKLQNTCNNLISYTGNKIIGSVLDLNDIDAVKVFFEHHQVPQVVVIAAGFMSLDNDAYDDVLNSIKVNYLSAVVLLNAAKKEMLSRNCGDIIVLSSVAGERGRYSNYLYGSSKAAITQFLSGFRARLYGTNINVLTVKCGVVATKFNQGISYAKEGRVLVSTPEKVANMIFKAFKKRKQVIYTPSYWALIMRSVKAIPEFIFRRLKL